MDLLRAQAFVFAVVPFEQIAIDFSARAEACQLASAHRTLQRAGEDSIETQTLQPIAQPASVALAAVGQRQIGKASVLSRDTPRGLAMPGEINDGQYFAHDFDFCPNCGLLPVARVAQFGMVSRRLVR